MNKDHKTMDITGPYAAKEGLQDGLPAAELNGDRDEDGLAVFGKRALLKSLLQYILGEILPKIEGLVLIVQVGGFFAVVVVLVCTAPHGSASEVS
ncbi:MAG: hypothetical protein Q9175_000897 [Cornicularia normoerica]